MYPAAPVSTSYGPTATPATTISPIYARNAPAPHVMTSAYERAPGPVRVPLLPPLCPCLSPNRARSPPLRWATTPSKSPSPTATPPASSATITSAAFAPAQTALRPSVPQRPEREGKLFRNANSLDIILPSVILHLGIPT